ncbi:hypothetical protein [Ignavibacterium sp.]
MENELLILGNSGNANQSFQFLWIAAFAFGLVSALLLSLLKRNKSE